MKRIIALTLAVVALLVWAGVRSDDSAQEPLVTRVRWSETTLRRDPTGEYMSLENATVLREVGGVSVVVGDWVEGSKERWIAVVFQGESLVQFNVRAENVGDRTRSDEASIQTVDDNAVSLRVFRDSGIEMEDVLVDPVTGVRFAVTIGEDVYGHHVLDAVGRVLRTSA